MMFGGKSESAVLWRKHYFVLLRHAILPILVFLFLTYITAATLVGIPVFGIFTLGWVTALASFLGMLGSFFWVLWEYDDWRQDIYIVTESRIIDVESSAFRLTGQTQREGNFDSVQNIYYKIPNFFYNLINLGDVIIETAAGATKNFTFVQVYNPSGVQEAIFDRWETFQRRKEEKQRGEVDKRIVTALEEYHDGDY